MAASRCFLAFELTGESRRYLKTAALQLETLLRQEGLPPKAAAGLRPIRPENWHATLLFFNLLDETQRAEAWDEASQWAADGAFSPLAFSWRGFAPWPSLKRPSLICLEAAPYGPAAHWPLARRLDGPPFNLGDTRHTHPYIPHITLFRLRPPCWRPLARQWEALALPQLDGGQIRFDRLSLLVSGLSKENPVYRREYSCPLA